MKLEIMAKNAALKPTELPRLVKVYSTDRVRRTLVAETVFDGEDWDAAKKTLLSYYGAQEKKYETSPDALRNFVKRYRQRKTIDNRRRLAEYYHKFSEKCGTMVADKALTDTERNKLFLDAFPSYVRKELRTELEPVLKARGQSYTKQTPPTVAEVLEAARALFNPDNMDYTSESNSESDKIGRAHV